MVWDLCQTWLSAYDLCKNVLVTRHIDINIITQFTGNKIPIYDGKIGEQI